MNATTTTLMWTLMLAVALVAAPNVAADGPAPEQSDACDPVWFGGGTPPQPYVDPECIGNLQGGAGA